MKNLNVFLMTMCYNERDQWEQEFQSLENTLTVRDHFYLMDEMKVEYLLPRLHNQSKTLEVGCGSARLSCFLASHGHNTTCIDYSPSTLKVARANYAFMKIKGNFYLGDAYNLPFKDETFAVVMSTGLLEHFKDPSPIISEMVRVLRPGGLYYSDILPNKFSLLRSLFFLKKTFDRIRGKEMILHYENKLNKKSIIHLLQRSGLHHIQVIPATVLPPRTITYFKTFSFLEPFEYRILHSLKPFWKRLDNTIVAEWLGVAYFAYAYK
jgi:ubiquinone/menaquinone biosynthesis C-methylase UbiE